MNAKVTNHLRQQRRTRKKTLKQQPGPQRSAQQPTSAHPVARRATSRAGHAARLTAVLAGCGILVTAAGSAAFQIAAGNNDTQPLRLPANYVAAPAVTEQLVCPPTPGEPEALSQDGVLDYADRDDSADSLRSTMLFASSRGVTPSADWVSLTDDGRGQQASFHEVSADGGGYAPLLADRLTAVGELEDANAPAMLEVEPLEGVALDDAPAAALGFTYQATEGPQAGLATATCSLPERSQWFLGPETGSGSVALLTLTNPHVRDATVEVTTYSAAGETGSLGATTVLVPAESVRTVNMAALTDGAAQLAVHVQASGSAVAGSLQSSRATGSNGEGTDLLPGMPAPRAEHHMLGVPAGADERPQLWIHTPGEESGTVELQVFDTDGQVPLDTPGVFSIEAGQVAVVDIEGLDPGTYEVVVRTEVPTLAAVHSPGDGEPVSADPAPAPDISWSAAAEIAEPGFGAVLPQTGETELRFFGQGRVTYRLFDSNGQAAEDVTVETADSEASLSVPYDELEDQAQEAGLDDLYALVITEAPGETRVGMVTRNEAGMFSIGALAPISPAAQYVPLRFER